MEASQSEPCPAACKPLQGGQHLMCLIEVVAAGIDPKATPPPPTHFQIQNWRTRLIVAADVGPRGHSGED